VIMRKLLLTAGVFLFFSAVIAQEIAEIKVIHRVRNDSVILRWAPTTAVAWQIGNKYGYKIYRIEMNDSLTTGEVLLAGSKKPLPLNDWEPLAVKNKYAAIAAQALYGDDFVVDDPSGNSAGFYNQVAEQQNRFGFSLYAADISLPVAGAMGLSFTDLIFDDQIRYVYKVMLQENPSDYEVMPGVTVVNPAEPQILPAPTDPKANFGDGDVRISWESFFDRGIYIAYTIERSEDGGKSFKKRSEVPFTIMNKSGEMRRRIYILDSLEQNYKLYGYRIRGITSFGETGPPSELLTGAGLGSARGITAFFDTAFIQQDGAAYLQWRFPNSVKDNLIGFVICNASKVKGPFVEISNILSPDQISFIDKDPMPVNYYVVKAIGRDSITTTSLPALLQPADSIAPSIPEGLQGKIDTLGVVYLDWSPSPERDVAGYRIFRANSPEEEYMQITASPAAFSDYRDKILLKTLTEDVYYKVAAIDHRDNISAFSEPLKISKPDLVPPVPPVFKSYTTNENRIHLEWINSISRDVVEYRLTRLDQEQNINQLPLEAGQNTFDDNEVIPGITYTYLLKAKDDGGLYSTASEIHVQAFSTGIKPAIKKIKAKADKTAKAIFLTWDYPLPEVSRFLIYRKKNDEPMRLFKDAAAEAKGFTDTDLSVNNIYHYQIKAVFINDDESELSEIVRVVY
jgi:fibronectin type 3 domain-containing protein